MKVFYNLYTVLTVEVIEHPLALDMAIDLACVITIIYEIYKLSMKLYSYPNFRSLFSTVDLDFRFLASYIIILEMPKFVYCTVPPINLCICGKHIPV